MQVVLQFFLTILGSLFAALITNLLNDRRPIRIRKANDEIVANTVRNPGCSTRDELFRSYTAYRIFAKEKYYLSDPDLMAWEQIEIMWLLTRPDGRATSSKQALSQAVSNHTTITTTENTNKTPYTSDITTPITPDADAPLSNDRTSLPTEDVIIASISRADRLHYILLNAFSVILSTALTVLTCIYGDSILINLYLLLLFIISYIMFIRINIVRKVKLIIQKNKSSTNDTTV